MPVVYFGWLEKTHQLGTSLPPKQTLRLAQLCIQCEYLVKSKLWGKYLLKSRWLFVHAIMMADCPTTGGYSKIGTVVSADLPLLAQCVPGKSKIRFRETTVAKAQGKFRALIKGLENIVVDE
jgi:hypothetical protein